MSSPSRRLILAGAAASMLAAGPAFAQGGPRKTGPVRRLFPYLDRYLAIPAASRSRFRLVYTISRDGRPAAGLRGWVGEGAARVNFVTGPDGVVRGLPTLAQLRANETATFEAPADARFNINMSIEPTMAPAAEMSATELAASLAQTAEAVRRAAGVLGMAVPRFTRIMMPGAQGGQVVFADGRRAPLPTSPSGAAIFDPAAQPGARTLRFSRAPSRMVFAPAARRGR